MVEVIIKTIAKEAAVRRKNKTKQNGKVKRGGDRYITMLFKKEDDGTEDRTGHDMTHDNNDNDP